MQEQGGEEADHVFPHQDNEKKLSSSCKISQSCDGLLADLSRPRIRPDRGTGNALPRADPQGIKTGMVYRICLSARVNIWPDEFGTLFRPGATRSG